MTHPARDSNETLAALGVRLFRRNAQKITEGSDSAAVW